MPAHLESSAMTTRLENVSFHSNPKEKQCQRMFKLLHSYTHFSCQGSNAQSFPSQNAKLLPDVQENFQMFKLDLEKAERAWQPTPVFLPGESHGQRSVAGYSPQSCKELDMTEATQHARTDVSMAISHLEFHWNLSSAYCPKLCQQEERK